MNVLVWENLGHVDNCMIMAESLLIVTKSSSSSGKLLTMCIMVALSTFTDNSPNSTFALVSDDWLFILVNSFKAINSASNFFTFLAKVLIISFNVSIPWNIQIVDSLVKLLVCKNTTKESNDHCMSSLVMTFWLAFNNCFKRMNELDMQKLVVI